jgi:hypothetical protein
VGRVVKEMDWTSSKMKNLIDYLSKEKKWIEWTLRKSHI